MNGENSRTRPSYCASATIAWSRIPKPAAHSHSAAVPFPNTLSSVRNPQSSSTLFAHNPSLSLPQLDSRRLLERPSAHPTPATRICRLFLPNKPHTPFFASDNLSLPVMLGYAALIWYIILASCLLRVPVPPHQELLKKFGVLAFAMAVYFGSHILAHGMVVLSVFFRWCAWGEAELKNPTAVPPDSDSSDDDTQPDPYHGATDAGHTDSTAMPPASNLNGNPTRPDPLLHSSEATTDGPSSGGFSVSVPESHWDEEDEVKTYGSSSGGVPGGFPHDSDTSELSSQNRDLLAENQKLLTKCNGMEANVKCLREANLADNQKHLTKRNELKTKVKCLEAANNDLDRRISLYLDGKVITNLKNKLQAYKEHVAGHDEEKSKLNDVIAHQKTVIARCSKDFDELQEHSNKQKEQIDSHRRQDQDTEFRVNTLSAIVRTLHESVEKNGECSGAAIGLMFQLVNANIPVEHLEIDLGRFAYHVAFMRLQWSQQGKLVGGFRASMSAIFGVDSRTNLVFVHHNGHEEIMPVLSIHSISQFTAACNDIAAATASFSMIQLPVGGAGFVVPLASPNPGVFAIQGATPNQSIQRGTDEFFGSSKGTQAQNPTVPSGNSSVSSGSGSVLSSTTPASSGKTAGAKGKKRPTKEELLNRTYPATPLGQKQMAADRKMLIELQNKRKQEEKEKKKLQEAAKSAAAAEKSSANVDAVKFSFAANPFDNIMGNANALPQNRGVGMTFSVPVAPPSSSRGLARGSARDADSLDRL